MHLVRHDAGDAGDLLGQQVAEPGAFAGDCLRAAPVAPRARRPAARSCGSWWRRRLNPPPLMRSPPLSPYFCRSGPNRSSLDATTPPSVLPQERGGFAGYLGFGLSLLAAGALCEYLGQDPDGKLARQIHGPGAASFAAPAPAVSGDIDRSRLAVPAESFAVERDPLQPAHRWHVQDNPPGCRPVFGLPGQLEPFAGLIQFCRQAYAAKYRGHVREGEFALTSEPGERYQPAEGAVPAAQPGRREPPAALHRMPASTASAP